MGVALGQQLSRNTAPLSPPPLTILTLNLGGTNLKAAEHARHLASTYKASVTVLSETRFHNALAAQDFKAHMGSNTRLLYRDAPASITRDGEKASQIAGIALVIHDPSITATQITSSNLGLLAVTLRQPGARPVLLLAAYLPPVSSVHSARRGAVLEIAAGVIRREQGNHACTILTGDLNSQLGTYCGRSTAADTAANHELLVNTILARFDMTPIHGRTETAAATSPRIGVAGGADPTAEVDYLITETTTNAHALPTMPFEREPGWHRPIGASIPSVPDSTPTQDEPPRKRSARLPPYSSPAWINGFPGISAALANVESAARSGTPARDVYALLTDAYADTNQTRARDNPVVHVKRKYNGQEIPVEAAHLLHDRREYLRLRHLSRDATERYNLLEKAQRLYSRAEVILKATRKTALNAYIHLLEHGRTKDARGLYCDIVAADEGTSSSNSSSRPPASERAFIDHYRQLLTEPDKCPDFWKAFYPQLPATVPRTWARYSWIEVYLALFPYSDAIRKAFMASGGHTPQCPPNCTQCTAFCEQGAAHAEDPTNVPAPKWMPTLKLDRAPGLDDVTAEMLRFFRSQDHEETLQYRERLARTIAAVFNSLASEGPPDGMVDVVISAIAKVAKDGTVPDPKLPDKTRGISVHNVFSKLHDILIDARFIHTIINEKIISPNQAGFMPHRTAEECVFMLVETIRARWRAGLDTYVLFVDFWKAYDRVSPDALWGILQHIGFPPQIIHYMQTAYKTRATRFAFNGRTVDVFEQVLGLCQGGVLSCLLFNIFIESLSRYLDSEKDRLKGVTVTTPGEMFQLVHALFADDMAGFAETRGALAALAEAINEWCASHGFKMTIKDLDKTVAVHFPVEAQDEDAPLQEPLDIRHKGADRSRDLRIPFAREYVYIGHLIRHDLCPIRMQREVLKRLRAALAMFMKNTLLPRVDLALQRSQLLSMIGSSTNHLLANVPVGAKLENEIDRIYLMAVAKVLRTSSKGLGHTGLADLRILPGTALLVRTRERFRLSVLVHQTPAAALMRAIHGETGTRNPSHPFAHRMSRTRSWCGAYYYLLKRAGFATQWRMSLEPTVSLPYHIKTRATRLARYAAYNVWQKDIRAYVRGEERKLLAEPHRAFKTPPPTLFIIRLHNMDAPVDREQFPRPGMYRPALYGAGVGASILGHTRMRQHKYVPLFRARLGRSALFEWPYWPIPRRDYTRARRTKTYSANEEGIDQLLRDEVVRANVDVTEPTTARFVTIFGETQCNLCGSDGGDLVHLCTTCPATAGRRDIAFGNGRWAATVAGVIEALYNTQRHATAPAWLRGAIHALPLASPECHFITARLITCTPWLRTAADPSWVVATRLGELFEKDMPLATVAQFADTWAEAALDFAVTIGVEWWKLLSAAARNNLERAGHRYLPPTNEE